MTRLAPLICVLLLSSLGARPAAAQTDSAAARALFSEGRRLMADERFDEACPKFEESLRLDHGMGTQFNLAHCWEKLGRTASAWALFLDVAAAARAASQDKREAAARQRAKDLEPRLTRLRVSVDDPAPGTAVTRDGQPIGEAAWGTAVPIDPGDHEIVAQAPGKARWSQDVKVPAASKTFSINVPELDDAPDEPSVSVDATRAGGSMMMTDDGGTSGQTVAALVVGGIGVAALAAGTVFALQFQSENEKALGMCRTPDVRTNLEGCRDETERTAWRNTRDSAKQNQLLGYLGFGVGGAALVTAVILYATADGSSESAGLQLTPLLGADAWGAGLRGRF